MSADLRGKKWLSTTAPCGSKLVSHVKLDLYLPGNKRHEATGFLGMLTVFPGAAALLQLPPEGEVCTHTQPTLLKKPAVFGFLANNQKYLSTLIILP